MRWAHRQLVGEILDWWSSRRQRSSGQNRDQGFLEPVIDLTGKRKCPLRGWLQPLDPRRVSKRVVVFTFSQTHFSPFPDWTMHKAWSYAALVFIYSPLPQFHLILLSHTFFQYASRWSDAVSRELFWNWLTLHCFEHSPSNLLESRSDQFDHLGSCCPTGKMHFASQTGDRIDARFDRLHHL